MGKNKKKRNKIYTGTGSTQTQPVITRISAANRSKIGQWWFEHKKTAKPIAVTAGVIIFVIIIIFQIIRIATGG